VEEFLKKALELKFVMNKIITIIVNVKDKINLLQTVKIKPSTSIMSTTYSSLRNY
jgi:hypothetical protein